MAFQLTRLNVPNLTTDYSAETNAAGSLAQTIGNLIPNIQKRQTEAQKQQILGQIGTGDMDFDKAGRALITLGDTQAGATLLTLGQKAKEQQREADWLNKNADLFGGAATGGGTAAPAPMATLGNPSVAASPRGVAVAETPQDVARLESQSSGGTQFGNRNEPRGLRNNNPGNIESGRFAATVQGFEGSDGRFARYATPEQGIQAADKLLQTYAGRGLNTVAGIVNRWAPPTENNTGAYVASVARELGVDPNQPLDMGNWETRQKLIAAKIRVENGKQPYSEDVFQRALNPNWGSEVASFEGRGAAPQTFIANAPPASDRFTPSPSQVARAPEPAPAQDGLYTNTPTPQLQAFINNPRVPENLRTIMRQEIARRGDGGVPVQLAQAPAQPGAPLSDADELNRAVPGAEAQFVIPGTTPQQTAAITGDKQVQGLLRLYDGAPERLKASIKARLDLRVEELKQQRSEMGLEGDLKREQLVKARRENAGEEPIPLTAEERQKFGIAPDQAAFRTRDGIKFGPAGTKIINEAQKLQGAEDKARVDINTKFIGKLADSGPQVAQRMADMDVLAAVVRDAPPGPTADVQVFFDRLGAGLGLSTGELATRSDAMKAIIQRLAPAQREEGSGSTSDIEFKGMLASFPSLATTAEGRQMILTTIARQNEITRMRIEVADQWTQGEIPATEARKKIAAIDKASIYASEDEKKLIRQLAGTAKGGDLGKDSGALRREVGGKLYEQRGGQWYPVERK